MRDRSSGQNGLRETKNLRTRTRIAEEGLRLFSRYGYDQTTLEAVAEAAGVSPRALYHHFKTKYEILLFFHDDQFTSQIDRTVQTLPDHLNPYRLAQACLLELVPKYEMPTMIEAYRVWNSTESLTAHKQMMFLRIEASMLAALKAIWTRPSDTLILKAAAMVSTCALRLAMDAGLQAADPRPLKDRLEQAFHLLSNLQSSSEDHVIP